MVTMSAEVKQPSLCTDAEMAAFCCFVRQGDEVEPEGLEDRVRRRGLALVFLWVDGVLVGIGALKRPDKGYRDGLFRSAGVPKEASTFALEVGWIFVPKEHRGKGYSRVIAAAAMTQADGAAALATTREDNEPMQRSLERIGFKKTGGAWKSKRGEHKLVLYVTSRPTKG